MQDPPSIEILLDQFAAFTARLARALADPAVDWQCRPAAGEWCLTEVACHLRDVEREVHQPRFRALIANDNAFLSGAVADNWVEERKYREQSGPKALVEFLNVRDESIVLLSHLEPHYWQRKGQHTFFGPTTMHELLNLAVQHDAAHWEQVVQLLAL